MLQIALSTITLSLIHAAIPNHWIPIVALAKSEKWSRKQTFSATFITGFSHTLSTIFIGIAVGFAGYKFSKYFDAFSNSISSGILITLGLIYIIIDRRNNKHHHHHSHGATLKKFGGKSKAAVLFSLSLAMFLTPCAEIEAYYFKAGESGWKGIAAVSAIYVIITIISMLLLVFLGLQGTRRVRWHYLEHHEKLVTGVVLLVIGLLSFLGLSW